MVHFQPFSSFSLLMLVPLTGVEGGGLNRGRVGVLRPRSHGFSVGTVHTDREDFFFGLSFFSLAVPGDMVWRGGVRKQDQ